MIDAEQLRLSALSDDAFRTVPAAAIEELLMLSGWLFETRDGGSGTAEAARNTLSALSGREPVAGKHGFDPAEVLNLLIAEGLRGQGGFWRNHYVPTGRRLVAELAGSDADAVPNVARLEPRRFRIAFRRTFNLDRVPAGARIRLRMPLPVEDAGLTGLEVETDAAIEAGRLEVKGQTTDTLEARFSFVAHPGLPSGGEAPENLGLWLAEREGPIQVTAAVRALADSLAQSIRDPRRQIEAFRDHLLDTMACGVVNPARIGAEAATDWVIARRWFDCRLGSALLAALCRARGIPARLIGGYLLWDAPSQHYWLEAWLPDQGWTPFDLLAWDLSAGGGDPAWRGAYAGATDYRMKTQIFPDIFTGAPGVPMGPAWHQLSRLIPGGTETRLVSIPDGALIYADEIRILKG